MLPRRANHNQNLRWKQNTFPRGIRNMHTVMPAFGLILKGFIFQMSSLCLIMTQKRERQDRQDVLKLHSHPDFTCHTTISYSRSIIDSLCALWISTQGILGEIHWRLVQPWTVLIHIKLPWQEPNKRCRAKGGCKCRFTFVKLQKCWVSRCNTWKASWSLVYNVDSNGAVKRNTRLTALSQCVWCMQNNWGFILHIPFCISHATEAWQLNCCPHCPGSPTIPAHVGSQSRLSFHSYNTERCCEYLHLKVLWVPTEVKV